MEDNAFQNKFYFIDILHKRKFDSFQ